MLCGVCAAHAFDAVYREGVCTGVCLSVGWVQCDCCVSGRTPRMSVRCVTSMVMVVTSEDGCFVGCVFAYEGICGFDLFWLVSPFCCDSFRASFAPFS